MSHGSLTEAVNASGPRAVDGVVQRLDAGREVLHRPRPRGLRVRDHLLAAWRGRTTRCAGCRGGPGSAPVRIDVWLASVTVGSPAIAPHSYAVPISISRATFGASPVGGHRVEHVGVRAVEQEADDVARPSGRRRRARRRARRRPGRRDGGRRVVAARSRAARRWWARRRPAGRPAAPRPSLRTPLPAITNGARACTTPSEPCSPRWPPWSSQLCAAECSTQRSGAAGWSKSWAIVVERERVRVVRRGAGAGRRARRRDRRAGRATGRRADRAPSPRCARSRRRRGRSGGTSTRPSALAASYVVVAGAPGHHVDDRRQLRVEQHVERGVEARHGARVATRARVTWWRSGSDRERPARSRRRRRAVGDDVQVAVRSLHRTAAAWRDRERRSPPGAMSAVPAPFEVHHQQTLPDVGLPSRHATTSAPFQFFHLAPDENVPPDGATVTPARRHTGVMVLPGRSHGVGHGLRLVVAAGAVVGVPPRVAAVHELVDLVVDVGPVLDGVRVVAPGRNAMPCGLRCPPVPELPGHVPGPGVAVWSMREDLAAEESSSTAGGGSGPASPVLTEQRAGPGLEAHPAPVVDRVVREAGDDEVQLESAGVPAASSRRSACHPVVGRGRVADVGTEVPGAVRGVERQAHEAAFAGAAEPAVEVETCPRKW